MLGSVWVAKMKQHPTQSAPFLSATIVVGRRSIDKCRACGGGWQPVALCMHPIHRLENKCEIGHETECHEVVWWGWLIAAVAAASTSVLDYI